MIKTRLRTAPGIILVLAIALALGLAAWLRPGAPAGPDCRAEQAARGEARPGFVALAGRGDPACLRAGG